MNGWMRGRLDVVNKSLVFGCIHCFVYTRLTFRAYRRISHNWLYQSDIAVHKPTSNLTLNHINLNHKHVRCEPLIHRNGNSETSTGRGMQSRAERQSIQAEPKVNDVRHVWPINCAFYFSQIREQRKNKNKIAANYRNKMFSIGIQLERILHPE